MPTFNSHIHCQAAQANVGNAMGIGTDIAMQSAEVTLVKGNLD